jgi:hypothetical protein
MADRPRIKRLDGHHRTRVMQACGVVACKMRQVADDEQRIVGPDSGDHGSDGLWRRRPTEQRHDQQIWKDRWQERKFHPDCVLRCVRLIVERWPAAPPAYSLKEMIQYHFISCGGFFPFPIHIARLKPR